VTAVGVIGLDHIQLAMPAGAEAAARTFYVGVLGLAEVVKPNALAARGGCWFVGPGVAIHLGVEDPFVPARKAHPGLLVEDLAQAEAALDAAGIGVTIDDSGLAVRRCYTADPFGNRIELIDRADAGFTDPAARR
jgi:catechol 2,3-dioxygenase-like lactoylglutathione lyase family enzyme